MDYSKIITIDPGRRSGKACVRNTRITVYDVLDYMASGMSQAEILADFPDLTETDDSCLPRLRRGWGTQVRNRHHVKLLFDENLSPDSSKQPAICIPARCTFATVDFAEPPGRAERLLAAVGEFVKQVWRTTFCSH